MSNENQTVSEKPVYVSSFVIGRKLASVTRERSYKGFQLADKDLEYGNSAIKISGFFDKNNF